MNLRPARVLSDTIKMEQLAPWELKHSAEFFPW